MHFQSVAFLVGGFIFLGGNFSQAQTPPWAEISMCKPMVKQVIAEGRTTGKGARKAAKAQCQAELEKYRNPEKCSLSCNALIFETDCRWTLLGTKTAQKPLFKIRVLRDYPLFSGGKSYLDEQRPVQQLRRTGRSLASLAGAEKKTVYLSSDLKVISTLDGLWSLLSETADGGFVAVHNDNWWNGERSADISFFDSLGVLKKNISLKSEGTIIDTAVLNDGTSYGILLAGDRGSLKEDQTPWKVLVLNADGEVIFNRIVAKGYPLSNGGPKVGPGFGSDVWVVSIEGVVTQVSMDTNAPLETFNLIRSDSDELNRSLVAKPMGTRGTDSVAIRSVGSKLKDSGLFLVKSDLTVSFKALPNDLLDPSTTVVPPLTELGPYLSFDKTQSLSAVLNTTAFWGQRGAAPLTQIDFFSGPGAFTRLQLPGEHQAPLQIKENGMILIDTFLRGSFDEARTPLVTLTDRTGHVYHSQNLEIPGELRSYFFDSGESRFAVLYDRRRMNGGFTYADHSAIEFNVERDGCEYGFSKK